MNSSSFPDAVTDQTSAWNHVRGFEPVSLCDWPGKVSCVLFVAGCNLRCPTCHNAELAWFWQDLPSLDRSTVLAQIQTKSGWLDGITVSGGEPTALKGLDDLLADLATLSLPLKLDSNGFAPNILDRILRAGLIQTVAVDVKGPWHLYPELTGQHKTAAQAKECLTQVFALAHAFPGQIYFRCTKVPLLTVSDLEMTRAQVPATLSLVFQEFISPQTAT